MIIVKTYRGHIRNWEELCERLGIDLTLSREEREHEILIKAYQTWGCEMADHMHGMFAFALWDEEEQKLFCLRDQFGTKPFYYYETEDGELLYGTMIRDIIDRPGFKKELNEEMLQLYLSLTYVAGENTFFRGLKKLLPGRYLIWQDGKLEIHRYWKPEFHPDESKTLEDWADEIHNTLKEIMPEVKTADEKVESFLSGGVDSSYVLAMSDAEQADSCGYEEERFDEANRSFERKEKMNLRKLELKDAPLMLEWMHDPDVVQNMQADFAHKTLSDCENFIRVSHTDDKNLHLAVVDDNNTYMGTVSLKNIENDAAEFAITVRKNAMGKGFSKYAMSEIIRIGLEELNLKSIYWCVSPENKRAVKFYDKNGYMRIDLSKLNISGGYSPQQLQHYIWYQKTRHTV